MTHHTFYTKAVCSTRIDFDLDEEKRIHNLCYVGGCDGNLKALGSICENMPAEEVMTKFMGICCGDKPTSCSDQLARCLRKVIAE